MKRNWHKDPYICSMDATPKDHFEALSQESKDILNASLGREKKSSSEMSRELVEKRGKHGGDTGKKNIRNYLHRIGANAFHQISRPKKSEKIVLTDCGFVPFI